MTLGRASSGAIKIKTDGGLRAVECACCNAVCGCSSVSAALKQIIESATTVSVNGTSVAWNGSYADRQSDEENTLSFIISYNLGVICVFADDAVFALNTVQLAPEPLFCGLTPFSVIGSITINGEEFRSNFAFPTPWDVSVIFS